MTEQDEAGSRERNPLVRAGGLVRNVRFVASMFLLLAAVGLLFQVVDNRKDDHKLLALAEQSAEQRAAIRQETELIEDCVTPGGDCFAKGQASTAEAVGSINIVSQFAVICGEEFDGEKAILNCVNERVPVYLKQQERTNE